MLFIALNLCKLQVTIKMDSKNEVKRPVGRPRKATSGEAVSDKKGKRLKMVKFTESTITLLEKRCAELGISEHEVLDNLALMFVNNSAAVCGELARMFLLCQTDFENYLASIISRSETEHEKKRAVKEKQDAEDMARHEEIISMLPALIRPRMKELNFSPDLNRYQKLDHSAAIGEIVYEMDKLGYSRVDESDIKLVYDNILSARAKL